MPTTRTIRIDRERSIATLARRMFVISDGRAGRAELARAEAAILRANPGLRDNAGFARGAPVLVPARTGLTLRDEVSSSAADGKGLGEEIALRLQTADAFFRTRFDTADRHRSELQERLGDREFLTEARRALPQSVEALTRARKNIERQGERDKTTRETLSNAVVEAGKALETVQALIRKRAPGDDT